MDGSTNCHNVRVACTRLPFLYESHFKRTIREGRCLHYLVRGAWSCKRSVSWPPQRVTCLPCGNSSPCSHALRVTVEAKWHAASPPCCEVARTLMCCNWGLSGKGVPKSLDWWAPTLTEVSCFVAAPCTHGQLWATVGGLPLAELCAPLLWPRCPSPDCMHNTVKLSCTLLLPLKCQC